MDLTNSHVDDLVEKARQSLPVWQALGFSGRKKILKAWAAQLTNNIDEIAKVISNETGKPVSDATLEATVAIEHLAWAAKNAEKILETQSRPSGLLFANKIGRAHV